MNPLAIPVLVACSLLSGAVAQRLVAVDSARTLYTIDLVTAAKTPFATVGAAVGTASALAYDAAAGVMFLASTSTDSLYTVDLGTGVATLVGPFGDPALILHGLELDTSTGQLYGCSAHDGGLYTIDRTTGAATLVGLSGLTGTLNLGYDSRADRLFATSTGGDSLYSVDRTTGAMALIGNLQGSSNPHGLAFHSGTGVLYLVDNASDQLYALDTVTGQGHAVGSTGAGNLLGLAFVPGGTGSIQRLDHHCGPATILGAGSTAVGGGVTVHVGAATGIPFVGFGLVPTALPFCGCTIGHEWALAFAGATSNVVIPADPGLLGVQVAMQGLDLFGTGGCADPAIGLTDTLVLTIG